MNLEREQALIESILFLETEPIDAKGIARITDLAKEVVDEAVTLLRERYQAQDHGIEIIEIGGGYMLSPKLDLWDYLKERYGKKNDNRLSRAALETLSIIAYSQPITKTEIENIRGVNADGMIKLLLSKDLIKLVGKKDAPGKPIQYGTTVEFLKLFKLASIADLPKLDELNQERFELDAQ
jgi:segregation and condensation protein B